MFRPPKELGSEAFNQAQSESGPPTRSARASHDLIKHSNGSLDVTRRTCPERKGHLREGEARAQKSCLHL